MVPFAIFNQDDYKYKIKIYEPIKPIKTENDEEDIKNMAQLHANAICDIIQTDPKQWFWPHKRFKNFYKEIYEKNSNNKWWKKGHLNQSIAFCKIKNISYDILEVEFKSKLFKVFSYLFDRLSLFTNCLFQNHKEFNYEFYDAIVSTGSGTYYFNKYISKNYGIKSIALMLPKSYKYTDFDYIIAQTHDNPPKLGNLIEIPLNLSYSMPKGILKKELNQKAIGIIIGGNNDIFTMKFEEIKKSLDEIFEKFPNYLKYVTTSRRTPNEIEKLLETYNFDYELIFSKEPNINPIPDFLTLCEELYITIDSTSMLSEAKANSEAQINIINLESKKVNTKFHKLAKIIETTNEKLILQYF